MTEIKKKILLENAYEAWSEAVLYAWLLKDGVSTLGYKKRFITYLHNSVELFLKQIMLDNCDYRVAKVPKSLSADGEPLKTYLSSSDLNQYFLDISSEERKKFFTIEFTELIEICKNDKLIQLSSYDSLILLNKLRNDETHFYISSEDYLSDSEFKNLYNFMVDFFDELNNNHMMPWAFGYGRSEDGDLVFYEKKLENFCFSSAIKRSEITKLISNKLYEINYVGPETDSAVDFTDTIWKYIKEDMYSFERTVAYIQSMFSSGTITFEDIIEEIPSELGGGKQYVGSTVKIKVLN